MTKEKKHAFDAAFVEELSKLLPQVKLDFVKAELEAAVQLREDLEEANEQLLLFQKEVDENKKTIDAQSKKIDLQAIQLDKFEKCADDMVKREHALDARERGFNIEILKKELECSKDKENNMKWAVQQVFGSPTFRSIQNMTASIPTKDRYGNTLSMPYTMTQLSETNEVPAHAHPSHDSNGMTGDALAL